jgi:hypothetical protein
MKTWWNWMHAASRSISMPGIRIRGLLFPTNILRTVVRSSACMLLLVPQSSLSKLDGYIPVLLPLLTYDELRFDHEIRCCKSDIGELDAVKTMTWREQVERLNKWLWTVESWTAADSKIGGPRAAFTKKTKVGSLDHHTLSHDCGSR